MQNGAPAVGRHSSRHRRGRLRSNAKTDVANLQDTTRAYYKPSASVHPCGGSPGQLLMLRRYRNEGVIVNSDAVIRPWAPCTWRFIDGCRNVIGHPGTQMVFMRFC